MQCAKNNVRLLLAVASLLLVLGLSSHTRGEARTEMVLRDQHSGRFPDYDLQQFARSAAMVLSVALAAMLY